MHQKSLFSKGHLRQFLAAFSATLVVISDGMNYGWSSPVIPILQSEGTPVKISATDEAWLEAMFLLSGIAALPATGFLVDKIGRYKTILASSICSIIGWILIGVATRVEFLYFARFIVGAGSDLMFVAVPMYISEICDKSIRGFLIGMIYIMMFVGVVVIYSVAPFVPFYIPSVIAVGLLAFQVVLFGVMPESPYFLVKKGRYVAALKSLRRLKAKQDCEQELQEITDSIKNNDASNFNTKEVLLKRSTFKGLSIVGMLCIAQHFCGLSAILMNLHSILEETGSSYLEPNTTGIIFAVIMLLTVSVSTTIVDKFGRRKLLLFSTSTTALSLLGLAVYCHVKSLDFNVESVSWLPILFVVVYAIVFNIGLGLVPKILASELFSTRVKAFGMTFGDGMYVIFGSLSILFYKYLVEMFELYVPFYVFSGIAFVTMFLTVLVIPETKGKSLEEIQIMLEQ